MSLNLQTVALLIQLTIPNAKHATLDIMLAQISVQIVQQLLLLAQHVQATLFVQHVPEP